MAAAKLPERDRRLVESLPAELQDLAVELWEITERNARSPSVLAEAAAERKRKWLESLEHLQRATTRALNGDMGSHAMAVARKILIDDAGNRSSDEPTMRRALEAIRKAGRER